MLHHIYYVSRSTLQLSVGDYLASLAIRCRYDLFRGIKTQHRYYLLWYSHPRTLGLPNITSGTINHGIGETPLTRGESHTHAPIAGRLCWGGGSWFIGSLLYLQIVSAANYNQYTVSFEDARTRL